MGQQMSARDHYERGLVLKRVQMLPQAIDDVRKAALDPYHAGKAHVQIALCVKAAGPPVEAFLEHTGQWFSRQAESLKGRRLFTRAGASGATGPACPRDGLAEERSAGIPGCRSDCGVTFLRRGEC